MSTGRWAAIELRHLAALTAVAREGSFRRASSRLGYVQSTISHQIATLEKLVGTRLIERTVGTRPPSLTPAGRVLLGHADAVLTRMRTAKCELDDLGSEQSVLRVGMDAGVSTALAPLLLRRFGELCPERAVALREDANAEPLLDLLERGELELAIIELPIPPGPFAAEALFRDVYVALVPSGSPLARRRRPLELTEIGGLPMIGRTDATSGLESRLRAAGVDGSVILRAEVDATVQALVGSGYGIAVVPRLSVDVLHRDTAVIELLDAAVLGARVLALAWDARRQLTPPASAFAALARDVCAELGLDMVDRSDADRAFVGSAAPR